MTRRPRIDDDTLDRLLSAADDATSDDTYPAAMSIDEQLEIVLDDREQWRTAAVEWQRRAQSQADDTTGTSSTSGTSGKPRQQATRDGD